MKRSTLEILACPFCHHKIALRGKDVNGHIESGELECAYCTRYYPIENGVPHFIKFEDLNQLNCRFAHLYNLYSIFYRAFSKIAFRLIGMKEETGRREILDQLQPDGGRVLEISIGPGVNLPYLINRNDVDELYGLDISISQIENCRKYAVRKNWAVELFLGNAEELPF